MLKGFGYDVLLAKDGKQCLAVLKQKKVDLVTLEIVVPDRDGLKLLTALKGKPRKLPVLIISGIGNIKMVTDAMRAGASDYLVKPFEEQELELAIENIFIKANRKEIVPPKEEEKKAEEEIREFIGAYMVKIPRWIALKAQLDPSKDIIEFVVEQPSVPADKPVLKMTLIRK